MPKHIYETGDPAINPANRMPVGLGPYKLQSWEQGRQLISVRNDNYWDQPKPYLDEIVVALIPEPAATSECPHQRRGGLGHAYLFAG